MIEHELDYLGAAQDRLNALNLMWRDSRVQCYNDADMPPESEMAHAVILVGPTSKQQILEFNWRSNAVVYLRMCGFNGWIFCPEFRGTEPQCDFTLQSYLKDWESDRLQNSTHIAFWLSRTDDDLTDTTFKLGMFVGMGISNNLGEQRIHMGWPQGGEYGRIPEYYSALLSIAPHHELVILCQEIASLAARDVQTPK